MATDTELQVASIILAAHSLARKHRMLRSFIFHYEVERDGGKSVEGAIQAAFEYLGIKSPSLPQ